MQYQWLQPDDVDLRQWLAQESSHVRSEQALAASRPRRPSNTIAARTGREYALQLSTDAFEKARVLVVGDVALDRYIYGQVERISSEAPVPVVRIGSVSTSAGCAGNVAANIAALGAHATLIGMIGEDAEAEQVRSCLQNHAPRVAMLPINEALRPTIVKTRIIAAGQQVVRTDQELTNPIHAATEDAVLAAFDASLSACDIVVISDYNKGLLTDRVLRYVIERSRSAGRAVLVDPKREQFAAYRHATILKPNRKELTRATGLPCDTDDNARMAAEKAIAVTQAMVLLTRSEQGMSLFRAGAEPLHVRSEAREVFDVSGAGDTVIAVMATALGAGMVVEDATRLANMAAGIVTGRLGTATVSAEELARAAGHRAFASRLDDMSTALSYREQWRRQGLTVAFTNGCFDLIHPGHIAMLAQAKQHCDRLIVGLNSDASVRRLKGSQRPIQLEEARAYILASVEHVDCVVLFQEDTPIDLIAALRPDVLVKGADYTEEQVVGAGLVKSWGGRVVLADIIPNQSSTSLVRRSRASPGDSDR